MKAMLIITVIFILLMLAGCSEGPVVRENPPPLIYIKDAEGPVSIHSKLPVAERGE